MDDDTATAPTPDDTAAPGRTGPSTLRNTLVAGAMFVGRALFAFVTVALVAKYLGPDGRGRVVFVSNLIGLVALAAASGTATGINRLRAAEGVDSHSLVLASGVLAAVVGALAAVLVVGVALLGDAPLIAEGIPGVLFGLLVVALVALTAFSSLSQVAALDNRLGAVTVTALVGALVYAAWTGISAALGTISVADNLTAWAVSSILPTGMLAVVLWRGAPPGRPSVRPVLRRLARISVQANLASLAVLAIWRIDVLIVELRRGYTELGRYSVAVALAEIVVVTAMALRSAILPHHGHDDSTLAEIIARTTRIAVVFTVVVASAVGAVGPLLIPLLFGQDYAGAYPALALLLPGAVLLVLHFPLFDFVAARSGVRGLTVVATTALAFNVAANWWALGRWSYVAASVVSSVTYGIVFVGCVWLFTDRTGLGVRETVLLQRADLAPLVEVLRRRPLLAERDEHVAGREGP